MVDELHWIVSETGSGANVELYVEALVLAFTCESVERVWNVPQTGKEEELAEMTWGMRERVVKLRAVRVCIVVSYRGDLGGWGGRRVAVEDHVRWRGLILSVRIFSIQIGLDSSENFVSLEQASHENRKIDRSKVQDGWTCQVLM